MPSAWFAPCLLRRKSPPAPHSPPQMPPKRKMTVVTDADPADDADRLEHERMASVLAQRGKLWTTHLAYLVAARGDFAVVEGEKRRWLAVLPKGGWKWVVDSGRGTVVPSAIDAAVKALGMDLAAFDPAKYDDDSEVDEGQSGSGSTAYTITRGRFELPLKVEEQLRNELLPMLMIKQDKVLEPKSDGVYCNDGKVVRDDGKVEVITASDHCVQTVGFPSTALAGAPVGFDDWYERWQQMPYSRLVDMVVASACLLGRPVSGEMRFDQQVMQLLVREVAGDAVICTADSMPFDIQSAPPVGTSALMLAYAASLAKQSVVEVKQSIACGSSVEAKVTLSDLLNLHYNKTLPGVQASHILYSCLRTSQACREAPREHVVKVMEIKDMLKSEGSYGTKDAVEKLLAKTFTDPPALFEGKNDRRVKAHGWVVLGVYSVKYIDSEAPRKWVPVPMREDGDAVALLAESEGDDG